MHKNIVLVIGHDPEKIMSKFEVKKIQPFIKYRITDASKIKQMQLLYLNELNKYNGNLNHLIKQINDTDDIDYFYFFTRNLDHDCNGNAICNEQDGKWRSYNIVNENYSFPLKNGDYSNHSKKEYINWEAIHLNEEKKKLYSLTWDICHDIIKPSNDKELLIYNNMYKLKSYFSSFLSKDEYVKYNTSYWTNSVICNSEWFDMEDYDIKTWIISFYSKFIENLNAQEPLTIFEYDK